MDVLVVGLGNPGPRYVSTRHNIGFMALDALHKAAEGDVWRQKFQGDYAKARCGDVRLHVLKPQTYMNESGQAVGEAQRYLKIPRGHLIVVHDEMDLEPGKVRIKCGGGDAGHNGLKSITAHCGPDYRRVRLGIGRPVGEAQAYVLSNFSAAEMIWVTALCHAFAQHFELVLKGEESQFLNFVHAAQGALKQQESKNGL